MNQTKSTALSAPEGGAQRILRELPAGEESVEGEEQKADYAPTHAPPLIRPERDSNALPRLPTARSSPTPWLSPDQLPLIERGGDSPGAAFFQPRALDGISGMEQNITNSSMESPVASQTAALTPAAGNGERQSAPLYREGTQQPHGDADGESYSLQVIEETTPSSGEVGPPRTLTSEESLTSQQ